MRHLLFLSCLALLSCQGRPDSQVAGNCRTIFRQPGPADFFVARAAELPRIFVASQERRSGPPLPPGQIDMASVADGPLQFHTLPLAGRDGCSFHPRGLWLVKRPTDELLYVLNRHDSADASPARGCFRLAEGAVAEEPVTSVEIFRVEPGRLTFLQRLAAPDVLTGGDDLVAEADGQVWVANPQHRRAPDLLEPLLPGGPISTVVHFSCAKGPPPCRGIWRVVAHVNGVASGIALQRAPGGSRLYLASVSNRTISGFQIEGSQLVSLAPIVLDAYPEGLDWAADGRTLLVAAHADLRRFRQHTRSSRVPSPSEVWRVPIDQIKRPERVFHDEGELVSAAATAACIGQDLFLGQVFGPGVWRCAKAAACNDQTHGVQRESGGSDER